MKKENLKPNEGAQTMDKEKVFKMCKESMEDVVGWKVFIFLHQNFLWRFFITCTILASYTLSIVEFFYKYRDRHFTIVLLFCDVFYFLDALCATLHFAMKKTRKLRHGKPRKVVLLFIDYISLMPINLVYTYIFFSSQELIRDISRYLRLNVCLRLYQIHKCFFEVKLWIYRAKVFILITVMEMCTYLYIMIHFYSCILYLDFEEQQKDDCVADIENCLLGNELLAFCLITQRHVNPPMVFNLDTHEAIMIIGNALGYVFTYGYLLPNVLFMALKFLRKFFQFSVRCKQLHLLVDNFVENKALREKILASFISLWMYGKGDRHPKVLETFPLCFRKSIFCDMHWDAFRHSEIFRELSLGCKRSLALYSKTEFVNAKTILLEKSEINFHFMYLESGLLQITAEENIKSPVISFSAGSVLGEISVFIKHPSKSVLQTAKFSVIHFLHFKDILKVLLEYPKDSRIVQRKIIDRLNIAKATQTRKMKIAPQFLQNDNQRTSTKIGQPNIKWVKEQFRAIMELHKGMQVIRQSQSYISYYSVKPYIEKLGTQLEHTTVNIPLVCVNDEVISKFDAVCLRMTFPWVVDPQSNFLVLWNKIVCYVAFLCALLYPYFLSWYEVLPNEFKDLALVTGLIYFLDPLMKFFVAVKKKNMIISNFWVISRNRIEAPTFYMDVLAAFPLHLIGSFRLSKSGYELNLFYANALLKTYKVFSYMNKWNYRVKPKIIRRTMLKWLFFSLLFTYWVSALMHLTGVVCVFYTCSKNDWFSNFVRKKGKSSESFAAFFIGSFLSYDIPSSLLRTDTFNSFILLLACTTFFRGFFFVWLAETVGVYCMEYTHEVQYRNLTDFIYNFMQTRKIVGRIKKRVMDTMRFQWIFDYGDYITQDNRIVDDIQTKLRDEIDFNSVLPALANSPLLNMETEAIQVDICRKSHMLALPVDSVLTKFGTQSLKIFFIYKGFVQINSFLPKDLVQNVSTNFVLKQGQVFPVIMTLNQMPAAISIRTITDCIFVVLELEDILTVFLINNMLKDVVDALKTTDFTPMERAKLGLSRVKTTKPKVIGYKLHKHGNYLRHFYKRLLLKKGINSRGKAYLLYEFFRIVTIVMNCFLWSFAVGISMCQPSPTFLCMLLALESLAVPDFYIRLHLVYYNKNGVKLSHPLATSLHYLKTSFAVDLLSFLPFLHIMQYLEFPIDIPLSIAIFHELLRFLSMYRYFGLIRYIEEIKKFSTFVEIFKIVIPIVIALNFYVNCALYRNKRQKEKPLFFYDYEHDDSDSPWNAYLEILFTSLFLLLRTQYFFANIKLTHIILLISFSVLGTLLQIHLFSFLLLRSTSTNLNFTTYQYYLKSFLNYLTSERAEDVYTNKAIAHFEHVWEKEKGEDLHKIFSRFPDILHEDLMYPIYKITLRGIRCLAEANEAFHRLLSRYLCEIHLKKGTEIIFQNQIEENLYFVHKGQCYVEKHSLILFRGSLIGDIRRGRVMKNLITADTHVVLLKISSDLFFLTMTNFQRTKSAFMTETAHVEDYVESIFYEKEENRLLDTLNTGAEQVHEDSEFVVVEKIEETSTEFQNEGEQAEAQNVVVSEETTKQKKKKQVTVINPNSKIMHWLNVIYLLDAVVTVFFIPMYIGMRSLTFKSCLIVYGLDLVWVGKIAVTLRTAYLDPKTGNLLSSGKIIVKQYLHRSDGLIVDCLSVVPFEIFIFLYLEYYSGINTCTNVQWGYLFRLLRYFYIMSLVRKERKKLSMNFYLRWMTIIGSKFMKLNLFAAACMFVFEDEPVIVRLLEVHECWKFVEESYDVMFWAYICVANNYVEAGLPICLPKTKLQAAYHITLGMWAVLCKAAFVNEVLTILYVTDHIRTDQMHELEQLEGYLMVRDVSPSLFQKMRTYFCDLMHTYKEAAMPAFLVATPTSIKIDIMNDLYSMHLNNCYIFQNCNTNFIKQLSARLERNIFFPGDYIVHEGDVDQNMYFVHKGEVYCIENDKTYTALETIIDLYTRLESFGVLQGILIKYPHKYTFRAKTLADVLVLNYYKWADLRQAFPNITGTIYSKVFGAFSKLEDEFLRTLKH